MNTIQTAKTDFIKFNVSPQFKILAEKKAREHGMTISELGRVLFGTFVTGTVKPTLDISPDFLAMVKKANKDHEQGKTKSFNDIEGAINHLHSL
jgi:hypothetical protein